MLATSGVMTYTQLAGGRLIFNVGVGIVLRGL